MEELATEMEWPDMNLFKEMRKGFKLVGSFETTGIFKTDVTVVHLSDLKLFDENIAFRPFQGC